MIRFQFKKIPSLAIGFYLLGFILIAIALGDLFLLPSFLGSGLMSALHTQQVFIAGGILVAIGSVINSLYHFL